MSAHWHTDATICSKYFTLSSMNFCNVLKSLKTWRRGCWTAAAILSLCHEAEAREISDDRSDCNDFARCPGGAKGKHYFNFKIHYCMMNTSDDCVSSCHKCARPASWVPSTNFCPGTQSSATSTAKDTQANGRKPSKQAWILQSMSTNCILLHWQFMNLEKGRRG